MTSPEEAAPEEAAPDVALPEVHVGSLDDEKLGQLLADLKACADVREVLVKRRAAALVDERERPSLEQAFAALRSGAIRALQVRYSLDGALWFDTLSCTQDGFSIVRLQVPS